MFLLLQSISRYAFSVVMAIDTVQRLRAALKLPGITKKALAQKAGLHANTLLGCESDDWNPTLNTLKALEPHLPADEPEQAAAA
jgi:DNA-binding XRE family transcriptional regulator